MDELAGFLVCAVAPDTQARIATNARQDVDRPLLPCRARRSEQNKGRRSPSRRVDTVSKLTRFPELDSTRAEIPRGFLSRWKMSSRVEVSTYLALNHFFRKSLSH
jgi:hypothetical protein